MARPVVDMIDLFRLAACLVLMSGGCNDGSADSDCTPGRPGCPCVDDVCLPGAVCEMGMCVAEDDGGTDTSTSSGTSTSGTTTSSSSDADASSGGTDGTGTFDGTLRLDVLLVVDNSVGTAGAQHRLASSMGHLVDSLRAAADEVDVHLMVTTTDFGNPLCTPFEPAGYDPARGAPTTTACTERLDDFTSLGSSPQVVPEACTEVCPGGVTFEGSFAAFTSDDDNAGGQIVEALRCVVPQGLNGCGYESPLESMLAALNPAATWNGDGGFLRQDSGVAVVLLTNEVDCSVEDYSIMENPTYQETNPDTAAKSPSSAICWNAGVDCQGPDPQGMYSGCTSNNVNGLHPITRYTSYLIDTIAGQGRFVVFVPIVGASPDGLESTVYRNWIDGQYPGGDILPPEWMQGVTAGDKQFDFGIGPGCTAQTDVGGWVQALPPVRLRETCEMIEADANGRCCPHSICGDIYTGGFDCLSSAAVELAGG